jgi:poly(A) polymerase
MAGDTLRQAAEQAVRALRQAGHEAFFAGGCVRDMSMGVTPKDIDIATDAPPEQVCRLFRRTKKVGAKFGVVLVRIAGHEIEVATFRTEGEYTDHRRPDSVTFTNARADATRRDFTINGMFYDPIADEVIDHVGGREDLAARRVRAIGDPRRRFEEDHLRMLRAVRFAARLDFELEHDTKQAIVQHAPLIRTISAERIRMELEQILTESHPQRRRRGWELIHQTGLSAHLVAGTRWPDAEAEEAARRLAEIPDAISFPLALAAALRHLTPKEAATACRRLRCSGADTAAVHWLLAQLPRAHRATRLELADVKLLAADPRCTDLLSLLRADLLSAASPLEPHQVLAQRVSALAPEDVAPAPLLTGDDLLAMNVPAGPRYRRILDAVYRAQLNEQVRDADAAFALARALIQNEP